MAVSCVALLSPSGASAQTVLPLKNPGFEQGTEGWTWDKSDTMSEVSAEAAHDGGKGLRVTDTSSTQGSAVRSDRFPAKPGEVYRVSFWGRTLSGDGMAVYLQFFDDKRKALNTMEAKNEVIRTIPKTQRDWAQLEIQGTAPENAAFVHVFLHSFGGSQVTADVDDFKLVRVSP